MSGKHIAETLNCSQSYVSLLIRRGFESRCKYTCDNCGAPTNSERKLCRAADCWKLYCREYMRDNRRRLVYGISNTELEALYTAQNGTCAICERPVEHGEPGKRQDKKSFRVDHDHVSGKVRGLLCHRCNIGLGYFGEDAGLMKKAVDYLCAS